MKFAICNEIFDGWEIEKTLAFVAKTGFDAIEIAPFTLAPLVTEISADARARVRDAAEAEGIAVSGIHWVLAKTEGFHLTSPDLAVRRRTAQYLVNLVDFCADLGGGFVVLGSPRQRNRLPGVTETQARDAAVEVLRGTVQRAEERGVTVCLEPLSPAETNFLNTAAATVEFTRQLASPACRVILDVKAMCSEPDPIPDLIHATGPALAYFHANDRNLKGPGFGDVDFVPIAEALRQAGYDGYVSVEVFDFAEGPEAIATRSLAYLQRCFGQVVPTAAPSGA